MRKLRVNPSKLKDLRPSAMLTGGFTLITAGMWEIFGSGIGMISGGCSLFVLQWWLDSD
ncbi:hypothetical protein H1V43_32165 [Streptomyces sp. PSKA54]|uniref:Uncharacterized protein n=1 Tax=Streptomyces himalayensis subsp. aureolus TaxID=2758039 RepID=A0A7W2HJ97_9ACTN|nr:hypothetical protein [Streptomyces himalayensis]MBA4865920.1 hypothetical protein [Streptomyces himalayensis subsp. aureolus]